jgi:hypothetical protein
VAKILRTLKDSLGKHRVPFFDNAMVKAYAIAAAATQTTVLSGAPIQDPLLSNTDNEGDEAGEPVPPKAHLDAIKS